MGFPYHKLTPEQEAILEKIKETRKGLTVQDVIKKTRERVDKEVGPLILTNEEERSLQKVWNNDLTVESNREYWGIIGDFVTLKLGDNGKSYKMFFPEGTTETFLDLFIANNKKEFEEIENYFKENGVNKPLKTSLLFLLGNIIKSPFWKPQDSKSKIFNVDDSFKHGYATPNDNAKLLLIKEPGGKLSGKTEKNNTQILNVDDGFKHGYDTSSNHADLILKKD